MAVTKTFWSRHKNLRIGEGAGEARFSNGICVTSEQAVISTLTDKKRVKRFGIVDVTDSKSVPKAEELNEVGDLKKENRELKEKLGQQENSIHELKEMVAALQEKMKPEPAEPKDSKGKASGK